MPRKSANERAMEGVVADVGPRIPPNHERPDPPADLSAPAAAIWTDVVASMRRGWFSKETHEQLSRYCNLMVECRRLEAAQAVTEPGTLAYTRVAGQLSTISARALSYARALRITPVSNRENKNILDARDPTRSLYRKPWLDVDDDDEPAPKKPWEI